MQVTKNAFLMRYFTGFDVFTKLKYFGFKEMLSKFSYISI